jgi:hypothetical protein
MIPFMLTRFLALALGLCLVTASCGGSGGDDSGDRQQAAAGDFPARYASGWCALTERCCQESGGIPEGECESEIQAQVTLLGEEAAAEGATWNAGAAGLCLDALASADCAYVDLILLRELLDVCADTWNGVVPPGGACQTYASCAEPDVTELEPGTSVGASCVNSTCVQVIRQPFGAPCSDDSLMLCDPFVATCDAGVCVALPDVVGQPCTDDCREGLACNDGTCTAKLTMGEACTVDSECVSDRCSAGQCVSVLAGDYCALQ